MNPDAVPRDDYRYFNSPYHVFFFVISAIEGTIWVINRAIRQDSYVIFILNDNIVKFSLSRLT